MKLLERHLVRPCGRKEFENVGIHLPMCSKEDQPLPVTNQILMNLVPNVPTSILSFESDSSTRNNEEFQSSDESLKT